ncbi:DNA-binding protein [Alkalicoccobacillus gibsonii]|uniref:DNA-binding protein n=1 Tax=Alkalicoccobacillus gibsonii TaxID=79881 RepID=UPI001932BABA|nr:DNA-binding protein [Alkalicoccobacillus gibsonii]MBM0066884.1 DNA-binding protein [Alkalicoccobacillus gibsonii]
MDSVWFAIALIGFAYFIGDGLKHFKKGKPKSGNYSELLDDELWGTPKLVKESKIHDYTGLSKEDAKTLVKDYPSVPHLKVNGQIYFPLKKLKAWIDNLPNA